MNSRLARGSPFYIFLARKKFRTTPFALNNTLERFWISTSRFLRNRRRNIEHQGNLAQTAKRTEMFGKFPGLFSRRAHDSKVCYDEHNSDVLLRLDIIHRECGKIAYLGRNVRKNRILTNVNGCQHKPLGHYSVDKIHSLTQFMWQCSKLSVG